MVKLEVYETQAIEGETERERMKNFMDKWERILDHIHEAMGKEALENEWKIKGNFGGCHYDHNNRMMSARLELRMEM